VNKAVFISHATEDQVSAAEVCALLEAPGPCGCCPILPEALAHDADRLARFQARPGSTRPVESSEHRRDTGSASKLDIVSAMSSSH
jgi:hypothetical protein